MVSKFEQQGFATLVRLPLKSSDALLLARIKLRELPGNTALFLERIRSLVLDDGTARRELTRRTVSRTGSALGQQEIRITSDAGAVKERYRVWSRTLTVEETSAEFRESIRHLPGKWPELREARVSIAVRIGESPDVGTFNVFLPTLLRTGNATHVNAPFFADMSRTQIDFDQAYNRGLLDTAWRLAIDVIQRELAGKGEADARMIVDLLAPLAEDVAGNRWRDGVMTRISEVAEDALSKEAWFLSKRGWSSLGETSLLPIVPDATVFTDAALREHATFDVFHHCMNTRAGQLEGLSEVAGFSAYPSVQSLASTAEIIARAIHKADAADWNAFWSELRVLMQDDAEPLRKRKVLLGRDGALHSAGEECAVFFAPRRGVGDDDELAGDSTIVEIPATLRPHVAFLHDAITLYDESNRQSLTRKFIGEVLVKRFRVEDIFTEVLIPRTPTLPVRLRSPHVALCGDILRWGLRLISSLVARGLGDKSNQLLRNLAVPCVGGWYRANTAAYGRGWPNSQGDALETYLTGVGSPDGNDAAKRMLLPADRREWGSSAVDYAPLLSAAGVFDGLRLSVIEPGSWNSKFWGSSVWFTLPQEPPPEVPQSLWEPYREYARARAAPYYSGSYPYQVQALFSIPGLTAYERLDQATRLAFMDLVLASICKWPADWKTIVCRKMSGSSSVVTFRSPLWFVLCRLEWMGFGSTDRVQWSAPTERWHVPAKVLGARTWQFDHLHPLPVGTARRFDANPGLAAALVDLGMPQYDLETISGSVRFLDALAVAAESDQVRDPNVFLGQVRSAWSAFAPNIGQAFPKKLLVHRDMRLVAVAPTAKEPVYIPDSARSFVASLDRFGVPVLAIEPTDAGRLAAAFASTYGDGIVLTSKLEVLAVVDGEVWVDGETQSLHDSEFEWVIEVALTLAAYGWYQSRGTGTARFASQMQTFREARLSSCATLSARLNAIDQVIEQPDVRAMWIADRKTLVVTHECREKAALLSEALASIIEREDLVVPLMLALREIGTEPNAEAIVRALGTLRLTEAQYLEVCEHWRGALRQVTDLLAPLITIFCPNTDISVLRVARNEQQVADYLTSLKDSRLAVDELLAMIRSATELHDFGLACFEKYGAALQLDHWNSALRKLGERPLENSTAAAEFAAHATQTVPALRSILAATLRKKPAAESARTLIIKLEGIACPQHYAVTRWEVRFTDVMAAFVEFFVSIATPPQVIELIRSSESYDVLVTGMQSLAIDAAFDPVEVVRKNRERARAMMWQLQELGLAWAVGISSAVGSLWESRIDRYMETLDETLATTGCLFLWSDEELFAVLRRLPREPESQGFWRAFDACNSLEGLTSFLGISSDRLVSARRDLANLVERARRQSRLISVCGREFDGSEDNLASLWSHIETGLSGEAVGNLDPIDIAEPLRLTAPLRWKPSGQGSGGGYRSALPPNANENLVGLTGEIHAFRRLQQQYGAFVVSPSSWVSSSALLVYPENTAVVNDSAGCDFRFVVERKTYHVEVKASVGTDEMFALGSSEVRLAMELSRSRRSRQLNVFVILRVLNALSERPAFQVLPNPYDERFRFGYDIVEAGARVRYRISAAESV